MSAAQDELNQRQRSARKALHRARYQRRYARHTPPAASSHYPAQLRLTPRQKAYATLRGVTDYLQQIVRMHFGAKGSWGHGQYENGTKKGPGLRRIPLSVQNNPAGTKLVRRFIRGSSAESIYWRKAYASLTGWQYGSDRHGE